MAMTAPASCAMMNGATSARRMPANVSEKARAMVTAGLAKDDAPLGARLDHAFHFDLQRADLFDAAGDGLLQARERLRIHLGAGTPWLFRQVQQLTDGINLEA